MQGRPTRQNVREIKDASASSSQHALHAAYCIFESCALPHLRTGMACMFEIMLAMQRPNTLEALDL